MTKPKGFRREAEERPALFWDITQRRVVIPRRRFGTIYLPNLQRSRLSFSISWPLDMGPIGCLETSTINYHYTLRNSPEEHRSQLPCRLLTSNIKNHKITCCLYGCETWSFTEGRTWAEGVNRTGCWGHLGVKGKREWREIHTEEHRDLYYKTDQETWDGKGACATCGGEKCVLNFDGETSVKRPRH
jgi:hypothetical protein